MKSTGYVLDEPKVGEERNVRRPKDSKGDARVDTLIWVECGNCGKQRWVKKQRTLRPEFTGLCHKCASRVLATKRPLEDRMQKRDSDGYLKVSLPDDHWLVCMAHKDTNVRHGIMVHRLIMAEHLKRPLEAWEIVHHLNGARSDNRIENLILTTRNEHRMGYRAGYEQGYKDATNARLEGFSEN